MARTRNACLLAAVALGAGCGGSGDDKQIKFFRLPSESMVPTFELRQVVTTDLAAYRSRAPRRGDVVIVYPPLGASTSDCAIPSQPADGHPCERPTPEDRGVSFIERVVGLPGEWLRVRNNRTYIASSRAGPYVKQDEPFVARGGPCDDLCNLPKPIRVPAGHYYLMGDNRGMSSDSRLWGPVPRSSVIAKVLR